MTEAQLGVLGPDRLLDYITEMREAGRLDCVKTAHNLLAFSYWPWISSLVSRKVDGADVEDLTAVVVQSALRASFDGKSIGEFRSWIRTITKRRIADYHRRRASKPTPDPLPGEDMGEDRIFVPEPGGEDQGYYEVEVREAAGRVISNRNEIHQLVIRLVGPPELGWDDLAAEEAAVEIERQHPGTGISRDNVYQVWSRFRKDLQRELGLGLGGS